MKKTSHTIIATFLLTSALALGLGTAQAQTASSASSTASATVKNAERAVSDSWITTKVKSEIAANSISKLFKVSVKTKSGNVMLSGKLPNQDAIDLVKMIAEKVKGVNSVDASGLGVGT